MAKFRDAFTGMIFEIGDQWLAAVRKSLAEPIVQALRNKTNCQEAANTVAQFWRDTYYERLFPLRFGLYRDQQGLLCGAALFDDQPEINLEDLAGRPLRGRFLDGMKLPPILPADLAGETTELVADRVLVQAAMANLLLEQQGVDENLRHAARLACLTYPLLEQLQQVLSACPGAVALARFFRMEDSALPPRIDATLMAAVRDLAGFSDQKIGLGLVAVQRIKRYVFETPGLNEIRGASTLLDDLTEVAQNALSKALGPEVVLRAVGATVMFLAPTEEKARDWTEALRTTFYRATGTAFTAAAAIPVRVEDLLRMGPYQTAIREAFRKLEEDRATAVQPVYEALPFEARCQLCRLRPAEGWVDLPGQAEPAPLCRVCKTKRDHGQPQRERKAQDLLRWLSPDDPDSPAILGVQGATVAKAVAPSLGLSDDEVPGFIPAGVRYPLLATIYGDGNNFGAVGQKLPNISLGLQWAHRVLWTTRAAAAIALGRATQKVAYDRGWNGSNPVLPSLPFQVLALGGDDLSLFAWAPVGIHFAHNFVRLTDLEFKAPQGAAEGLITHIAFSLGALLTDHKAAVRRTVEVTEEDLLKWAKQAFHESKLDVGNIVPLLAMTQEQIPDDLDVYRQKMFLNQGTLLDLYLTLRPFTADELDWLLREAYELREHAGLFHRLVAPFIQSSPLVAILHYVYQRGRFNGRPDHWLINLESRLQTAQKNKGLPEVLERFHYPAVPASRLKGRKPFGLHPRRGQDRLPWFTPLWDLLELVKVIT